MSKPVKTAVCVLGWIALLAANAALAQGPPMPKAGPEHQRLHYFVGQWKNEGDVKPSPFGPGGKFSGTDNWEMLGDFWVVAHSKGTGPMGTADEIATMGYDPKQKAYIYNEFNSLGMHDTATGQVSGKTWTWTNEMDMGGKTTKGKFTINEESSTSYTYKFDISNDNGATWKNVMEGKATKVK